MVGCVRFFSIFTISSNMVLSAWLFCWVGCFSCVFRTCIQLRQSVKICAGSFMYLVVISESVSCMAISSALKHVCSPGSLFDICTSGLDGLYIPYPAFSFFQWPSSASFGGKKDPSV